MKTGRYELCRVNLLLTSLALKAIAELVPGRNHSQCLQRWNKVLKPGLIKGTWSPDEDALLRHQIQIHGDQDSWMKGRAEDDIKKKWRQLHPKQEKKRAGRLPKLDITELMDSIKREIAVGRLPRMDWINNLTIDNNDDNQSVDDDDDKDSLYSDSGSTHSVPAAPPIPAPAPFKPPFLSKKKKMDWDQTSLDILTQLVMSESFRQKLSLDDMDAATNMNTQSNWIMSMEEDPVVARVMNSFRADSSNGIEGILQDLDAEEVNHLLDFANASQTQASSNQLFHG
ncbi:hypothetical protein DYB32_001603 [Aphanomyces invadans]|uniref:Myb-like domain-containing protein n=1 Tax=Aphanomyces invadans TaxID=157072 RepID=A0A418B5Q8_9STRA|nr:hypothetical protein DYB32_001603 [Aphanomyces invadans]